MYTGWPDEVDLGPVTVLTGRDRGAYPHGNSVLVRGNEQTLLIDPSLTVHEAGGLPGGLNPDLILLSHCHEDHLAGLSLFPGSPVLIHPGDRQGLDSIERFMDIYGMAPGPSAAFAAEIVSNFHYQPRPDAGTFVDGEMIDLGGVTVEIHHAPGHTRGHTVFVIPEARAAYLGDIDLSGFGPYYGDAWSDLEAFEDTIAMCEQLDAEHFITFHHKGVISGRAEFLSALDRFASAIERRETAMIGFLSASPRTLEEMVAHRFIYRPHVELVFADSVEKRSIGLHLDRLTTQGRVKLIQGRYHLVAD